MIAPESKQASPSLQTDSTPESSLQWACFSDRGGGLLVVGHGTRNPAGSQQLIELVDQMRAKAPEAKIFGCFLELAEPSIERAISQLHLEGVTQILIVPVLLFTAGHALQDIPEAVQAAANKLGVEIVGQTTSLGTHPSVLSLSAARYREVTALMLGAGCPNGACARVRCESGRCEGLGIQMGRIGLAMVGRGTSDEKALAHMRQLTASHVGQVNAIHYQTGFFAGGKPNVDGLLDEAACWDCDTVIVQPHLLFEGELIEQLRAKVMDRRVSHPDRQWFVARTLGADPKLASVFLDLAAEFLASKFT